MGKVYIHYGAKEFQREKFNPVKNLNSPSHLHKPYMGFWASATNAPFGWRDWNEQEEYRECDERNAFLFTLKEDARCLVIDSYDTAERIEKEFPRMLEGKMGIDFEELSMHYDVIDYRHSKCGGAWDIWDCDSIVVMNPDVVIERPMPQLDKISEQIKNHAHFLARDCQGWENMCADFRGMDLSGVRLLDADLSQARFEGAVLNGTAFENVNLTHAVLDSADITYAKLVGVNCSGASFNDVTMDGTYVHSANFHKASFMDADMACMDINLADFQDANMKRVNLAGTVAVHSSFMDTDLRDMNLPEEAETIHIFDTENVRVFVTDGSTDFRYATAAFYSQEDDEVKPCTAILNLNTEKDGEFTHINPYWGNSILLSTCRNAFHGKNIHDATAGFFPQRNVPEPWMDPEQGKPLISAGFYPKNIADITENLLDAVMGLEKAIEPPTRMDRVEEFQGMRAALKDAIINRIKELGIEEKTHLEQEVGRI